LLGRVILDLVGWRVKYIDASATSDGIKIDIWIGSQDFDQDKFTIPK